MKVYLIDTHLLVPRSRSSAKVKVKYQGNVSQKMAVSGALMFHKHILFSLLTLSNRKTIKVFESNLMCSVNPFPYDKFQTLPN